MRIASASVAVVVLLVAVGALAWTLTSEDDDNDAGNDRHQSDSLSQFEYERLQAKFESVGIQCDWTTDDGDSEGAWLWLATCTMPGGASNIGVELQASHGDVLQVIADLQAAAQCGGIDTDMEAMTQTATLVPYGSWVLSFDPTLVNSGLQRNFGDTYYTNDPYPIGVIPNQSEYCS